jgi:hypothetical protein
VYGARSAGIRMRGPRAIEVGLQSTGDGSISCSVRTRAAGGWHRTGSKLGDDSLPHLCIRTWCRDVECIEGESGRSEPLVVARDAVLAENFLRCRWNGCRRRCLLRRGVNARSSRGNATGNEERKQGRAPDPWEPFPLWPSHRRGSVHRRAAPASLCLRA